MKLANVSASQIKTFLACQRKWHWGKIGRKPRKNQPSARRGTAIHEALELYLKNGSIAESVEIDIATGNATGVIGPKAKTEGPPDKEATEGLERWNTARFVRAAIPYIPKPPPQGPSTLLEQHFRLPTLKDGGGPPLLGFIDLLEESRAASRWADELKRVRVTDYKSTSDIRRYALTPDELSEDVQAVCYAKFVFDNLGENITEIELRWLYLETRNKVKVNVKEVSIVVTREHVEAQWAALQPIIREMARLSQVEDSKKVEPTVTECSNYGGCDYKEFCGVGSLGELLAPTTKKGSKSTMGLLQKMKAAKAAEEKENGILSDDAADRETTDEEAEELASKGKKKTAKKTTKKTTKKTKPAPEPGADGDDAGEDEPPPTRKKRTTRKKASKPSGFTIYVDCAPSNEVCQAFEAWVASEVVAPINDDIEEDSFWLLPFGEQKAVIAAAVEVAVSRGIVTDLVVMSSDPYARDVLPLLVPHAERVVRALRG